MPVDFGEPGYTELPSDRVLGAGARDASAHELPACFSGSGATVRTIEQLDPIPGLAVVGFLISIHEDGATIESSARKPSYLSSKIHSGWSNGSRRRPSGMG